MIYTSSSARTLWIAAIATVLIFQSARAQDLDPGIGGNTDGTLDGGGVINNPGGSTGVTLISGGAVDLTGSDLGAGLGGNADGTLDGGGVINNPGGSAGTTTISGGVVDLTGPIGGSWTPPISGATLTWGPNSITTTGGNLDLTLTSGEITGPFTISSGGSLEINGGSVSGNSSILSAGTIYVVSDQNDQNNLGQVIENQGISVTTIQSGLVLGSSADQPLIQSQAVPEPSSWSLVIICILALFVLRKVSKSVV